MHRISRQPNFYRKSDFGRNNKVRNNNLLHFAPVRKGSLLSRDRHVLIIGIWFRKKISLTISQFYRFVLTFQIVVNCKKNLDLNQLFNKVWSSFEIFLVCRKCDFFNAVKLQKIILLKFWRTIHKIIIQEIIQKCFYISLFTNKSFIAIRTAEVNPKWT